MLIDSFKEIHIFKNSPLCKHDVCVLLSKSYVSMFIGSVLYYNYYQLAKCRCQIY